MLNGELDGHLGYEKHQSSGFEKCRNGYGKKSIKSKHAQTEKKVLWDRRSTFEPVLVPKRSQLSTNIESLVRSLYAEGMINSNIAEQLQEIYGFQVSIITISEITDKPTNDIVAWQNRPLESVYLIVWIVSSLMSGRIPRLSIKPFILL